MSHAARVMETGSDLLGSMQEARAAADALLGDATYKVRERVTVNGRTDAALVEKEQRATHGLAWLATYAEAIRQFLSYAERMSAQGRLGEIEELLVRIGAGEFLAQMAGGILMSQGELVRPADLGLDAEAVAARFTTGVEDLIATGNTAHNRARLIALMATHSGATVGDCGLDDILDTMREEMRKFAASEVTPHAQQWHRTNSYIPLEVIAHMAELGVFGLTIPEEYGGLGLGKESMCVVSEELSRGYIGVGSIGRCCRRRYSPSPTPAPTSPRCAPARNATATSTRSAATRPGSPIRCAPT
jgi:(2S)-methylsuccinyl-CoA dehydrogenase